MPKIGLKCFVGSFILSLAAVFAATRAYVVMSAADNQREKIILPAETKNIELFAVNEDPDPLKAKVAVKEKSLSSEESPMIEGNYAETTILYMEDEEDSNSFAAHQLAQNDTETETTEESVESDEKEDTEAISDANQTSDEVQIVDAADAPIFQIPLLHNFKQQQVASVSSEADNSQIALAGDDVRLKNLGATNKTAHETATEVAAAQQVQNDLPEDDDPWEVAQVSNKHTTKNSIQNYPEKTVEQKEEQVPYKMQKNLLIPIPDDIMREKNLTPQFSSSAENLRLEEELRAKKQLPPRPQKSLSITDEDEEDVEAEDLDEQTSRSLTESIAAWFSGNNKNKEPIKEADVQKASKKEAAKNNEDQSNSIFHKLLGIGQEKNITPTELKLAFQPNRAEISGQTLEWLHAFSDNAVKYENVIIEIRIAKSAPAELQQKRLKLLYKILANNGVEYKKINILFTDRDENSFIIRNVRYATEEEKIEAMKLADNPWY